VNFRGGESIPPAAEQRRIRLPGSALGGTTSESRRKRRGWNWWYLLLLVPFVAVLWPPFYNRAEPAWIGMPFFYWYQLLWVIVGAALTAIVHFATGD
jgi:hypothetical protein